MAYLHRIAAWLLLLVVCCWWTQARAGDIPQTAKTTCPALQDNTHVAEDRMIPPGGTFYDGYEGIASPQTSSQCVQVRVRPDYNPGYPPFWNTIASFAPITGTECPVNSTENPDSTTTPKGCKCNAGWKSNAGNSACIPGSPACPDVGVSAGNWTVESSMADSLAAKYACPTVGGSGCVIKVEPTIGAEGSDGKWYVNGKATYTGGTCNPNVNGDGTAGNPKADKPAGTSTAEPADCKFPKQLGTVNGSTVCLPAPTDKPTTTKTGTGTTTTGTDPATGQPVTTTTDTQKTATCTGDTCTVTTSTTTTTTVGTGTPTTKTDTKTDTGVDKGSYCRQNPKDPVCVGTGTGTGNGTFAGVCGAEPACTGDAVQCAIARADFKTSCAFAAPSSTTSEESTYDAAKAKTGDQTGDLAGNSNVTVSASSFDQTERLGAASGLADLNITVAGNPVTLQLSMVNEWLQRLGAVLVAVTFVLCIGIVRGNR